MMKFLVAVLLSISACAFAQTKPAFSVAEISYLDREGYQKDVWPKISSQLKQAGAEVIVAGGRGEVIAGASQMPDKITVVKFKSLDSAKSFYASKSYQELRNLAEKYIRIKVYIVGGE
jgi:uncharacterized protein (DUF1330 family)